MIISRESDVINLLLHYSKEQLPIHYIDLLDELSDYAIGVFVSRLNREFILAP